jgi:hypothetical protein
MALRGNRSDFNTADGIDRLNTREKTEFQLIVRPRVLSLWKCDRNASVAERNDSIARPGPVHGQEGDGPTTRTPGRAVPLRLDITIVDPLWLNFVLA